MSRPPLIPPPAMEIPRWWSNPGLTDPETIITLVLENPTTIDLATIIGFYGLDMVSGVRDRTKDERTPIQERYLTTLWKPVVDGYQDALQRVTQPPPSHP